MQEILTQEYANCLNDLKQRVANARYRAARSVNRELIILYHYIGGQILKNQNQYGWGIKVIDRQIESNLHKRQGQAVSNSEEKLPSPQSDLANQTLKDPYLFDFLSLGNEANEREIEKSLVGHLEAELSKVAEA